MYIKLNKKNVFPMMSSRELYRLLKTSGLNTASKFLSKIFPLFQKKSAIIRLYIIKFNVTFISILFIFITWFIFIYFQQHRLHAKYVSTILMQAASLLKKLPNLNVASTAISKQITVCGDLHGKLDDLLTIFHKVSCLYFTNYFNK